LVVPKRRTILWFFSLALIAGIVGSSIIRIVFRFDPMVTLARGAVVKDAEVKSIIGEVKIDDVSVYRILKTGDPSQAFAREEYSASVTGSSHGALVTVLIKKSYVSGEMLGTPKVIDIRVRD